MSLVHAEAAQRRDHSTAGALKRDIRSAKRRTGSEISTLDTLYGHALAMAQEAIARYGGFATHAADKGNDEVADLFSRLSELSGEQACHLAKATRSMVPPKFSAGEHSWLYNDVPAPEGDDFLFRMMTPRLALQIALDAETRAMMFFVQVRTTSKDSGVREFAIDLGREKESHVAWLRDSLSRVPMPFQPGEDCPGDPATPQAL